jgi:hypothetical protein
MRELHSRGSHYDGSVPCTRHLSAVCGVLSSYTKTRCIFRVEDIKAKAHTDAENFVVILIPYETLALKLIVMNENYSQQYPQDIHLSMAVKPFVGPWPLFGFLIF